MTGDEQMLPVELAYPNGVSEGVAPPRVSRRSAMLRVIGAVVAGGVAAGAVWAWLAPGVQGLVALTRDGDRVRAYVGEDADHLFLAATLMVGLLTILALTSATAVWKWRVHRGPEMVGALSVGLLAAAGAATGVGAALASLRYDAVDVAGAPVTPENRVHYFTEAPGVFFGHSPWQIAATIALPAGIGALAYAIGALSTTRDDLGAWPPAREMRYLNPVIGPAPTTDVAQLGGPSEPSH